MINCLLTIVVVHLLLTPTAAPRLCPWLNLSLLMLGKSALHLNE